MNHPPKKKKRPRMTKKPDTHFDRGIGGESGNPETNMAAISGIHVKL